VGRAASAPPAPPAAAPESFATLEQAEQHFQDTEEGRWTPESLKRFTADVMIKTGTNGPWRFPYTHERLRQLRAFTASPASDYTLFAKAKDVRCPVLVFRGGMSKRFAPAAEQPLLQAFGRPIELVVCPKSGHFPTSTEPEVVIEALKSFLAGVPRNAASQT
jgi:pimeloyl-ACP methyl ester carboxylesterase